MQKDVKRLGELVFGRSELLVALAVVNLVHGSLGPAGCFSRVFPATVRAPGEGAVSCCVSFLLFLLIFNAEPSVTAGSRTVLKQAFARPVRPLLPNLVEAPMDLWV